MKVLLVSPYYQNIWEPLWAGYLISYCKHHNSDVEFDFCHGNFDTTPEILRKAFMSDVVAFSATSPTINGAVELARRIKSKNPKIVTVLGGWHVTTSEDYFDCFDHYIFGEGEKVFSALLRGEYAPFIEVCTLSAVDFDELSWPDRKAIHQERHLQSCYEMSGERIISLQSRRGCPMSCVFCAEKCMTGHNVRVRNPEDVLDELDFIRSCYTFDKFKFVDPTWCYPKTAAYDFCEAKIKRGNTKPWEAMGHAAFLDKDILKLMKEANCCQINVGVENGCQSILNDMNKGVTVEKIKKVFKWCHELDLEIRGFFLLGMPNESFDTVNQTFDLIKEIRPDVFGMTILAPYPGTDFYDKRKYSNVDWSYVDEYSNKIWRTKNFTNDDLKRIQKVFYRAFKDIVAPHMVDFFE